VLILYGYHENEDYSRCVAQGIERLDLDNLNVKRYDWNHRNFGEIMRETDADWVLDLHSHRPEHMTPPDESFLYGRYLGTIGWGWVHDYNNLMETFFDEYYDGVDVLSYGKHGSFRRIHSNCFTLGLLWYRAFEKELKLVKNLTDYLKRSAS